MTNNSQWFDSPHPYSFNFEFRQVHFGQEQEDYQNNRNLITPTPLLRHPLSPFTHISPESRVANIRYQVNQEEIDKVIITDKLIFSDEDSEQELLTPKRLGQIKQERQTTSKKKQTKNVIILKKPRPKQKGLKGLSSRAFDVVKQVKQTSYKLVAQRLLAQLKQQLNLDREIDGNEQTNVKRRVYDALNVLIAVGVLRKQGKTLIGEKILDKQKNTIKQQEQIILLRKRLNNMHRVIEQKKKKLKECQQKLNGVRGLLRRNQNNYQAVHQEKSFISFPFVGVIFKNQQLLAQQLRSSSIQIYFSEVVRPFGDMDCLRWL